MTTSVKPRFVPVIAFLALLAAACNVAAPAAVAPAPTVDTSQIVETVLSQVEQQLPQQLETVPVVQTGAAAVAETELEEALIQLYQEANSSVAYIVTPSGSGSGFVYSDEGHIVTNNHVVEGSSRIEVVFANGERQRATLVGADVDSDLAVLKVSQLPDGVTPLPLAGPDDLQVGQFVVAIGNPFGEQGSMSLGIVSGLGRSLASQRGQGSGSSYSLPDVIQTDAPINPGNSGGPLLNLQGEVVGINSAIASTTGENSGVGFSIPVRAVLQIVPGLLNGGEYHYPYIGAAFDAEVSLEEQSAYGLNQTQGAYVVSITSGGPADEAGLVAADTTTGRGGDLVVSIDGQAISNFADLNSYLVFHTTVGQTIELTILRQGEELVLPLTLGERP